MKIYLTRLRVFILLMFFLSIKSFSQKASRLSNPVIEKSLLLEDLKILKENLEKAHPGLYNYTNKKEMDDFFESLKDSILGDMTSIDFFRLIAPLSNKIRNGHTILVPPSKWEDFVITDAKLLPFDLYYHDEQIYVLRNLSHHSEIVGGSVLKTINGRSAKVLFDFMVDRWFKDGYNKTRPQEIVEEEYRFLYSHFFGPSDSYHIEIISPEGKQQRFQVDGITENEFQNILKRNFGVEYVPWWRRTPELMDLTITDDTAHLKISLFNNAMKSTDGKRFGKFVDKSFEKISKNNIQHLILDLRGNAGGDVNPQLKLLEHLVKTPFHLYKEVFANTRELPNPEYYEFDMISRMEFKKNFENEKTGNVYNMKSQLGYEPEPHKPSENLFDGNLYVLIDGWSFSATGEVCGILKEHRKNEIFIGEETGGNPVTNISGIQTFMTLPHSKCRILICLVSYTTAVTYDNDGHGVQPDYEIRNSVYDILKGYDKVLEMAKNLILKNKIR
ncbi:MAG: S41 family peptidase [Croceivirga sp.]